MESQGEKEFIDRKTEAFISSVCPFGWLDVRAGIVKMHEYGFTPDDLLNALYDFKENTGQTDLDKIDIGYVAYDFILQEVRNKICDMINFDICNDAGFYTYGNYCCSSFDYSEEDKKKLAIAINEADENSRNELLQDEKVKIFLEEIELLEMVVKEIPNRKTL